MEALQLIRSTFLGCEYRRGLTCVSSERGSHDVVGESGEAKMENSVGRGKVPNFGLP